MVSTLRIGDVMTQSPHTIGADIPLGRAEDLMRVHQVRHLPVLSGGTIVGVISDRDVKLSKKFDKVDSLPVEEFMTADPYIVSADAPLSDVVEEMSRRKIGSVIVTDEANVVVGIFTAVDGLRILGDFLSDKSDKKVA